MQKDLHRLMRNSNLIPSEKQNLISNIANHAASLNMPCYIVGGFVRDLLLGKPINDFDIVVEGDAIKFGDALVKKYGGKLTPHHKFHTAIWHLPSTFNFQPSTLDLITARKETYSRPGALPTVTPSTIHDDLRRRDFTINAMAVRLDGDHFGELLDPLDGQSDLDQKIIRVLHPRSFIDDPTRIFRAIRYAARYSFILHPSREAFILINPESFAVLQTLSGERIRHEFDLIFEEENSARMLARLDELGIFGVFNPSLPKLNEKYSDLLNSKPPTEFGISANRVMLGYLLWLMDAPSNAVATIAKRFDFTSDLREAFLSTVQLKNDLLSLKDSKPSLWTFRLEKIPPIAVYALWLVSNEPALKEFLVRWRHVKPKTTGGDLKARGLAPSPRYGEILTSLCAAWLDGEVKSEKEEEEMLNKLL
jgi:tRNA nucleotidyltransferase (CCA-adding enzyme)